MKKTLLRNKQFLVYCLIGGTGTALTCLTYTLLVNRAGFAIQTANAIGYTAGTLLSFILNACFNFRVADKIALRLATFFGVALTGWLASALLLQLLVRQWHWNAYYAYFVVIFVVVLLQYNLNRRISFHKAS